MRQILRWSPRLVPLFCSYAFVLNASAQDSPEVLFDDSYLLIDLENEVNGQGGGSPAQVTYQPNMRMRFFHVEEGDAVRVVWKKGREVLSEKRCTLSVSDNVGTVAVSDRCWRGPELTAHGDLAVEIKFVNDAEETETTVRTLQVPVHRYWNYDRTYQNRHIHSPRFQVRGDDLLGLSYAWLQDNSNTEPYGNLYFYYWSTTPNGNLEDPSWRCKLNGEAVREMNVDGGGAIESIASIRVQDRRRVGADMPQTDYGWHLMWIKPSLIGGPRHPDASSNLGNVRYNVSEHPGDYVCRIRSNGETVREFLFTIRDDGTFAPHGAQTSGELTLRPGATFVTSRIHQTDSDAFFDQRAARGTVAFGRAWGRAGDVRDHLGAFPASWGSSQPRPPQGSR